MDRKTKTKSAYLEINFVRPYYDIGNLYMVIGKLNEAMKCFELGYKFTLKHLGANTEAAERYKAAISQVHALLSQLDSPLK